MPHPRDHDHADRRDPEQDAGLPGANPAKAGIEDGVEPDDTQHGQRDEGPRVTAQQEQGRAPVRHQHGSKQKGGHHPSREIQCQRVQRVMRRAPHDEITGPKERGEGQKYPGPRMRDT
ncbi:hypothetical protein ATO11_18315 [Pseudaestuariivita atlantica]|uniref:Uncharacterized protein n=1 Tax=Pseudaestuariivita atlantica TaxID=1317121 RepID=A0A0L1JLM6_9RHOB|nr:hypothetical protein ATO11_18315 [Pseudaestuariivita atlantica]